MISTIFKVFKAVFTPKPLNQNEPPVPAPLELQRAYHLDKLAKIDKQIKERDERLPKLEVYRE